MADPVQQINWLPTRDEFEAMLAVEGEVSAKISLVFRINEPLETIFYENITSAKTLSHDELSRLLDGYTEFKRLISKFERSGYTLIAFALDSDETTVKSSLVYVDERGRHHRSQYIRNQPSDWFTDDLLTDLKRLTNDDTTTEPVVVDVLANALGKQLRGNTAPLVHHDDVAFDATDTSLKLSDFKVGDHFTFNEMTMINRVTDIGARTLVYFQLDQDDPRNYNGPPYSVVEHVLDEQELRAIKKVEFKEVTPENK